MMEAAIAALVQLFEHRKGVQRLRRRIWNLVKYRRLQIVIFGAAGTGKTTLYNVLKNPHSHPMTPPLYEASIFTESNHVVANDLLCKLVITAGQESRKATWNTVFNDIENGDCALFINVVCYGYHSIPKITYKSVNEVYRTGMTKANFMDAYTEVSRKRELEVLKEAIPHLANAKQKVKVLTIVTKEDLWWHERKDVHHYYESGDYANCIRELDRANQPWGITHELVYASLIMINMTTNNNEELALTTAGYQETNKESSLRHLLDVITKLAAAR